MILVTNFTTAQPDDILNSKIGEDDWSGIQAVQDGWSDEALLDKTDFSSFSVIVSIFRFYDRL